MAMIKVITYYHRCDACGKDIISDGSEPKTGVVGSIEFPDSADGQRRTFSFYSCKEQDAHIAKAMKLMIDKRKADVLRRKNSGEAYSSTSGVRKTNQEGEGQ